MAKQGMGAFGSRLRRLVERLDRDVHAIYRAVGERFEPRWYAVFTALRDHGPLTVGELAQRLGITHAAVSQVRTALEKEKLIAGEPDPQDGRRQRLKLTARGRQTAQRLAPLWAAIAAAASQLLAEGAPTLLAELDGLDAALDRRGLGARVGTTVQPQGAHRNTGTGPTHARGPGHRAERHHGGPPEVLCPPGAAHGGARTVEPVPEGGAL